MDTKQAPNVPVETVENTENTTEEPKSAKRP
jgi:hypothetical protein